MSIAIKIGNEDSQVQGFIYLDATTSYTRSLSGKPSRFPLDSGAKISDHFISENPKFSVSGVVSDADLTGVADQIKIDDTKPINAHAKPSTVRISGQDSALQYLPVSVRQFFDRTEPTVAVDEGSPSSTSVIELLLSELMKGVYYNQADNRWRHKMTPVVLYEMEGSTFINARTNLVVTDVEFSEDVESGDALHVRLSFEEIRFANIELTDAPTSSKAKKIASEEKKGTANTTSGTTNTETGESTGNDAPRIDTLNAALADLDSKRAEGNK